MPNKQVEEIVGEIPYYFPSEQWLEIADIVGFNEDRLDDCIAFLDTRLVSFGMKRTKNWTDTILLWKDENDNEVKLSLPGQDKIFSLSFEMDMRFPTTGGGELMLELAHYLDALIYTKNHTLIKPDKQTLNAEIKASLAYRFCRDPYGTLEEIGRQNKQNSINEQDDER